MPLAQSRLPTGRPVCQPRSAWRLILEHRAECSLAAVERDFIRDTAPQRATRISTGSARQPNAWTKYLKGHRTPTPPGKHGSPVDWAELKYPGTASVYSSDLWWVLNKHNRHAHPRLTSVEGIAEREAPQGTTPFGRQHADELIATGRLDAFAELCWRLHFRCDELAIAFREALAIRLWLCRWSASIPAIRRVRSLFLTGLDKSIPRLGVLSRGVYALDDGLSEAEQLEICLDAERH